MAASYEDQKIVFGRLKDLGVPLCQSKMLIVFWMWLESNGLDDFLENLVYVRNTHLIDAGLEAEMFLNSLQDNPEAPSSSRIQMPATLLAAGDYSFCFQDLLLQGRENSVAQITQLLASVSSEIFGERYEEGRDYWKPVGEEHRCLRMTFNGEGVPSKTQIGVFFSELYGSNCVEKLYLHKPRYGPITGGRIVFKNCLTVAQILQGSNQVQSCICGHWILFMV